MHYMVMHETWPVQVASLSFLQPGLRSQGKRNVFGSSPELRLQAGQRPSVARRAVGPRVDVDDAAGAVDDGSERDQRRKGGSQGSDCEVAAHRNLPPQERERGDQRDEEERNEIDEVSLVDSRQVGEGRLGMQVGAGGIERRARFARAGRV